MEILAFQVYERIFCAIFVRIIYFHSMAIIVALKFQVLHYTRWSYSKNGQPTMKARRLLMNYVIGQVMDLSASDLRKINNNVLLSRSAQAPGKLLLVALLPRLSLDQRVFQTAAFLINIYSSVVYKWTRLNIVLLNRICLFCISKTWM